MTFGRRLLCAVLPATTLVAGLAAPLPVRAAYSSPQVEALAALRAASTVPVTVRYRRGFPVHVSMDVPAFGGSPADQARDFLGRYAALYLQDHPDVELIHATTDADGLGGSIVRFAQRYQDLPVFGAELVVHVRIDPAAGPRIVQSSGALLAPRLGDRTPPVDIDVDLEPAIRAEQAEDAARDAVGAPAAPLRGRTLLMLLDEAVFPLTPEAAQPPRVRLVYRVSLGTVDSSTQVLVDANDGQSLFEQRLTQETNGLDGFDLEMWDSPPVTECPGGGFFVGDESGTVPSYANDPDAQMAYYAAVLTYAKFHDTFGRHGWDDNDARIRVRLDVPYSPARAAASCGISFSDGWTSIDVLAHEFTHHVTAWTSDLVYSNEPGALNESFSDIMGSIVDVGDWLLGEDMVGGMGPVRSMSDPPSLNCRLTDYTPIWFPCPDRYSLYRYSSDDGGGVHTNSNIINKAFFLMANGGLFNGRSVSAMGRTKMGWLAYVTFTSLPANAGFQLARDHAVQMAINMDFANLNGFTPQDVCSVRNAFAAVELGAGDIDCDGIEDNITDSDGDGILDDGDFSGQVGDHPCPDGVTQNCDDNCPGLPNPFQNDSDGDGGGDICDSDDDNDGYPDWMDPCLFIPNDFNDWDGDGLKNCVDPDDDDDTIPDDGDGDGTAYNAPCPSLQTTGCDDNCPTDPNPDQFDGNSNGKGDACDPDYDGDGFYMDLDNCQFTPNPDQADGDGDGLGDACDDCPGTPDNMQAWTPAIPELGLQPMPYQPDSDMDGIPDACDPDWGRLSLTLDGVPWSLFNAVAPGREALAVALDGPPGGGDVAVLPFPVCNPSDADGIGPDDRVELVFDGVPDGIAFWVENGDGRVRAHSAPSAADPTLVGLRFPPRCDEEYRLMLATGSDFGGSAAFSAFASILVSSGEENPWTSDPDDGFTEPPPIPDDDGDGLWNGIDLCPSAADPTNADSDADGYGDACDSCPGTFNPDQLPVAFDSVLADDSGAFRWDDPVDFDYGWGPLDEVAGLGLSDTGSWPRADSYPIVPVPFSTYYLFKLSDCGTWGSATRDAVMP